MKTEISSLLGGRMAVKGRSGFALVEMVLGLVLAAVFWVILSLVILGIQRLMCPLSVPFEGTPVPLAPSAMVLPRALQLNRVLSQRLAEAKAVYAFGGLEKGSEGSFVPSGQALALGALPDLQHCERGLPLSAERFRLEYASELGAVDSQALQASDFSLLVLGPRAGGVGVVCFVQCRTISLSVTGYAEPLLIRTCRLWDWNEGACEYRFAERVPAVAGLRVGAWHSWYRLNRALGVGEEGPVVVVLPDPSACPAGAAASSRFVYCVAVSS